jgi:hypothetical protein
MTIEDYVYSEIAKLLKEKGFNEACLTLYRISELAHPAYYLELDKDNIIASTQQMAICLLREMHNLWIDIDPLTNDKWTWSIWFMNDPNLKMGESSQSI